MPGIGVGVAVGLTAGSGGLELPTTNLIAKLDYRYGVTPNGDYVQDWASQPPAAGPVASNVNIGEQPYYGDGSGGVVFDATDDNLAIASWLTEARCLHDGTGGTLLTHFKLNDISAARYFIWSTMAAAQVGFRLNFTTSASGVFRAEVTNGVVIANAQTTAATIPAVAGRTYTAAVSISASSVRMLIVDDDGHSEDVSSSFSGSPSTGNATNDLTIGRVSSAPAAMTVASIAIWTQVHTDLSALINTVRTIYGASL